MKDYNPSKIEPKWQKEWEKHDLFSAPDDATIENKMYILPQLPYPSGSGLHVGHVRVYTGTDIIARYFADASKYRADLDFNGDGQISILDISNISAAYGSCQGNATYNSNLDLSKALNCIGLEDISILETRFADSSRYLADLDFRYHGEQKKKF